jgi:hypothetical protein
MLIIVIESKRFQTAVRKEEENNLRAVALKLVAPRKRVHAHLLSDCTRVLVKLKNRQYARAT